MKTYVLIDRSGSMARHWIEMTGAMKNYASEIKGKMLVAVFDGGGSMSFDKIHDGKAKKWDAVAGMKEHSPRGMTPLYDAIGALNTIISNDNPDKCQIVIVTDGHENASHEQTKNSVTNILNGWDIKKYDVVWLGAAFGDVLEQSGGLGLSAGKTVNMAAGETFSATMSMVATRNAGYAKGKVKSDDDLGDEIRDAAKQTTD